MPGRLQAEGGTGWGRGLGRTGQNRDGGSAVTCGERGTSGIQDGLGVALMRHGPGPDVGVRKRRVEGDLGWWGECWLEKLADVGFLL